MTDELKVEPIDKTASKAAGKDTGSQPENGSISDLSFDDVPENLREAVKAKTALKAKNLQSGFTKKTEELKSLREKLDKKEQSLDEWGRIKEEIEKDADLGKKLNKTWDDHKSGRVTPKSTDKDLKLVDKLIDQTDDASTKEDLRRMREIIKEESGVGGLREEVTSLKDEIKLLRSTTRSVQTDRVDRGITSLRKDFGDVVDKYEDLIKSNALKFPGLTTERIFLQVADETDIETAYLEKAKQKQKKKTETKKAGLEPGGEGTVTSTDIPRDKSGRIKHRSWMEAIVQKKGLGKGL